MIYIFSDHYAINKTSVTVKHNLFKWRKNRASPEEWGEKGTSPPKNVWFVDAQPRDIAKFTMAAIPPPSFVHSSGKKINCAWIWDANAYTDFVLAWPRLFIILSHLFLWDSFPCDARVLAVLPDSTLDLFKRSLFTITKDTNISEKSRVTRKNGLCSQLDAVEK